MLENWHDLLENLLGDCFSLLGMTFGIIDVEKIIEHNLTRINDNFDVLLFDEIKCELHHAIQLSLYMPPNLVDFTCVMLYGLIEFFRGYLLTILFKIV